MKKINLSADGGGTSLRIVAFGDSIDFIAESLSHSVNPNFEDAGKISENMREAADSLFAGLSGDYEIQNIYATIVGDAGVFREILTQRSGKSAGSANFYNIPEAHSHLFAASLSSKGGIALSGTGSGAIYCDGEKTVHLGGIGIPVGDEGSGASIGIRGMSAAVKHINGWGEETLLAEKLYAYLNVPPPGPVTGALYKKNINQRSLFAGFCPYVAECERAGDRAAKKIIHSAGRDMGLQMISAIKRAKAKNILAEHENPVIYASGGAWKGTPYMLEVMDETIRGEYPGAVCQNGLFDPVIGGAVKFIFDRTGKREISNAEKEYLKKEFGNYLFKFH
jgi:N-acetylglucosamine kinase-like BadF-type ATPase